LTSGKGEGVFASAIVRKLLLQTGEEEGRVEDWGLVGERVVAGS
jgi:hypothetical protein